MTTLNSENLREVATMFRAVGNVSEKLLAVFREAAAVIDDVADGKVDPSLAQGAIDKVDAALAEDRQETLDRASLALDEAALADDPEAWRDAMMEMLPVLSTEQVCLAMDFFEAGIAALTDGIQTVGAMQ